MTLTWTAAGVIACIAFGVGGPVAGHFINVAVFDEKVTGIEIWQRERRTELDSMHQREQTLSEGLVNAHNEVALARAEISGKLDVLNANLQHVRETLDEVRDVQHKNPSSLNKNGQ